MLGGKRQRGKSTDGGGCEGRAKLLLLGVVLLLAVGFAVTGEAVAGGGSETATVDGGGSETSIVVSCGGGSETTCTSGGGSET